MKLDQSVINDIVKTMWAKYSNFEWNEFNDCNPYFTTMIGRNEDSDDEFILFVIQKTSIHLYIYDNNKAETLKGLVPGAIDDFLGTYMDDYYVNSLYINIQSLCDLRKLNKRKNHINRVIDNFLGKTKRE